MAAPRRSWAYRLGLLLSFGSVDRRSKANMRYLLEQLGSLLYNWHEAAGSLLELADTLAFPEGIDREGCLRMQTIHFTCPHCKNLMAVGSNLLGRNVRCPHCKQVVQAPANNPSPPAPPPPAAPRPAPAPLPHAPAPAPAPDFPQFQLPPPPQEEPDSIFGEVDQDEVFARPAPSPVVPPRPDPFLGTALYAAAPPQPGYGPIGHPPQFHPPAYQPPQPAFQPPPPAPPPPTPGNFAWTEPTVPEDRNARQPVGSWTSEPTAPLLPTNEFAPQPQPWNPQQTGYPPQAPAPQQGYQPASPGNPWATESSVAMPEYTPPLEAAREPQARERTQRGAPRGAPARAGRISGLTWALLIWAVVATGGAIVLLVTRSGPEPAFMSMPDFFGEFDKADRKKTSSAFRSILPATE